MVTPNVPAATSPSEPSVWADIAAELHRVADEIETLLIAEPAPRHFQLNIQPHNADGVQPASVKGRPETVAAVDAVAVALTGKPAETYDVSGGFHHGLHASRGPLSVAIYQSVVDPDAVDPLTEIERLRAENAELRAAAELRGAHPTWPTEQELKPWESLAPAAERVAASMKPIDPDSSMEAHYDAEADEDPTGLTYGRGDEGQGPQQLGKRVEPHFESGREVSDV